MVLVSGAAAAEPKQLAEMATHETMDRSLLPPARIRHPYPDVPLDVTTRGKSPVR
ncbi:hypothetical protein DF3PB_5250001 [uncultured Defluviicoccus sp.]|uniref:Uncharacterized protein n=1 Tax=metagenome TaxID=256318 RepID=A0A380THV5_9ZZZZ|nr:hypothetical protein DF3PB_5250001 [uncultured Defluviicoccus sp.]